MRIQRQTPEYAIKQYLKDGKWSLLNGSKKDVWEFYVLLSLRYNKKNDGEYAHSSSISLLDKTGMIVFREGGLRNGGKNILEVPTEIK